MTVRQNPGTTAMFSYVLADSDTVVASQWLRNGNTLTNGPPYSDVDTPTLTISNIENDFEGDFSVQLGRTESVPIPCSVTIPDVPVALIVGKCLMLLFFAKHIAIRFEHPVYIHVYISLNT